MGGADLTYDDLAEKLKKHGFKETKASIANKLARATLPANFFLASLVVIGAEVVRMEDI
jgi:virulence-associated protein VapD